MRNISITLEIADEDYLILEKAANIQRRTIENYILYWIDIVTSAEKIRDVMKEFDEYKGMMTPYEISVIQRNIDDMRQKFNDRRDSLNILLNI